MEDSYLISKEIKDYCAKHDIENLLNKTINTLLTTLPPDPFSSICQFLKEVNQNSLTFLFLSTVKTFSS